MRARCVILYFFFFVMLRRPPRSTLDRSSAASDVYKRQRLGSGNAGLQDAQSGVFRRVEDIQQLSAGEVGLLKGEAWAGNEGAGLVHRSPTIMQGMNRLLLTLDIA